MSDEVSRRRRRPLAAVACCVVLGLCLIGVQLAITHVTARGQPRALWRASLVGVDIGLNTWPAAPGMGGYVELWYERHDAEDFQPLFQLPGAPPMPVPPTPRPGEISI